MSDPIVRETNSLKNLFESVSDEYIDSFIDRFWDKVDKDDNCWFWDASTGSHGYGQINFTDDMGEQHILTAHRVSVFLTTEINSIKDRQVNHTCHVKECVNPNHLYLGTQQDNVDDSIDCGAMGVGIENVSGKLTDEEVKEIRNKYSKTDKTQYDLARQYDVTQTQIWRIVNKVSR